MTLSQSDHTPAITIQEVSSPEDMERIFQIRDKVFVDEQALTPDARHDPDDRRSIHYLAFSDGEPVGTGRLTILGDEAQIAWVAVLIEHRGEGIGWALMEAMIERAERERCDYIILNAQTHALRFYERLGFEPVGDTFTMSRIEHQVMIRTIREGGGRTIRNYLTNFGRY